MLLVRLVAQRFLNLPAASISFQSLVGGTNRLLQFMSGAHLYFNEQYYERSPGTCIALTDVQQNFPE